MKFLKFHCKVTLGVCTFWSSTQIMREITLFSRKVYTAGTNFTRPPVVTVATNLNSDHEGRQQEWRAMSVLKNLNKTYNLFISVMYISFYIYCCRCQVMKMVQMILQAQMFSSIRKVQNLIILEWEYNARWCWSDILTMKYCQWSRHGSGSNKVQTSMISM